MSNVLKYAYGAAGVALATALVWTAWSIDSAATDLRHAGKMASLQANLIRQCDINAKRNERIVDDLHKELTVTRNRVNALKLRNAGKVVPVSKAADGVNGADNVGAAGRDGVDAEWLFDFAGQAEELKHRLDACQTWAREVSEE
jgi:hypothetical protein